MTGPQHYQAAENLIASCNKKVSADGTTALFPPEARMRLLAEAQVHATLALAAATALADCGAGDGMPIPDYRAWKSAAGVPEGSKP